MTSLEQRAGSENYQFDLLRGKEIARDRESLSDLGNFVEENLTQQDETYLAQLEKKESVSEDPKLKRTKEIYDKYLQPLYGDRLGYFSVKLNGKISFHDMEAKTLIVLEPYKVSVEDSHYIKVSRISNDKTFQKELSGGLSDENLQISKIDFVNIINEKIRYQNRDNVDYDKFVNFLNPCDFIKSNREKKITDEVILSKLIEENVFIPALENIYNEFPREIVQEQLERRLESIPHYRFWQYSFQIAKLSPQYVSEDGLQIGVQNAVEKMREAGDNIFEHIDRFGLITLLQKKGITKDFVISELRARPDLGVNYLQSLSYRNFLSKTEFIDLFEQVLNEVSITTCLENLETLKNITYKLPVLKRRSFRKALDKSIKKNPAWFFGDDFGREFYKSFFGIKKLNKVLQEMRPKYEKQLIAIDALKGRDPRNVLSRDGAAAIIKNPSLYSMEKIDDRWVEDYNLEIIDMPSEKLLIEKKWHISVYLNVRELEVNEANVKKAIERIKDSFSRLENLEIYGEKNVTFLAGDEEWGTDKKRFGLQSTINAIQKQGGRLPESSYFRLEPDNVSLKKVRTQKNNFFENLKNCDCLQTDLHGTENRIWLTQSEMIQKDLRSENFLDAVSISVDEVANHMMENPGSPSTLILFNCIPFGLNLLKKLKRQGYPSKANIITASEEYTTGLSNKYSAYGNSMFEHILGFGEGVESRTFGDIIKHQYKGETNMTVLTYDPDDDQPIQIGQNQDKQALKSSNSV